MKKLLLLSVAVLAVSGTIGCTKKNNDGTLEKTGERLDEAVENIKDGELPFKEKGTMEKLGENVDQQVEKSKQ